MGRTLKSCTVSWTPTGDPKRILGWNVVLNDSATNPYGGNIYKQVFVPKPSGTDYSWIGQQQTYTIKNVVADGGATVYAWVQQVYRDGDSEWLSSTGQTAADDGLLTANELLGPEQTAGKGIKIINGGIQSADFTQPTGSAQGVGFRIQDGKVEAYGSNHTFGGPTFFTDGNFLVSIGRYLNNTTIQYPKESDFTVDGQIHVYNWSGSNWTELCNIGKVAGLSDTSVILCDVTGKVGVAGEFRGTSHGVYGYAETVKSLPLSNLNAYGIRGYSRSENLASSYATSHGLYGYGVAKGYPGYAYGVYSRGCLDVATGSGSIAVGAMCWVEDVEVPSGCYGYGIRAHGPTGPIMLDVGSTTGPPTHAAHKGTIWLDSNGVLYVNTSATSPGTTWQKVGAQ